MNSKLKLTNPNPYDVLGVSQSASNQEITQAFTLAMKRQEYPLGVIAQARKSLMNPQQRLVADYLRPLLSTPKRWQKGEIKERDAMITPPEILPEFIDPEIAMTKLEQISNGDRLR